MDAAPARAWRVALEKIEADLLCGVLAPGDHLPPERELAASLGIGRSSVREALRVLEVLGLIRTATGSGPAAGAIVTAAPQGGMSALLRLQVAAQGFPIDDVVRTRVILESAVVDELARRATSPARTQVDAAAVAPWRILAAMDDTTLAPAEFLVLDAQFHIALAEASGNAVVTAMMTGLRTAIEDYVLAGADRIPSWDEEAAILRRQHHAVLDAVERGDADAARALVADHITGYHTRTGLTH